MKKITVDRISKSTNSEELVVYYALSMENQIRFYINENQYIASLEKDDGDFFLELGEDTNGEKELEKDEKQIIKKNKKKCFALNAFIFLTLLLTLFVLIFLVLVTQNVYIVFFSANFIFLVKSFIDLLLLELVMTSVELKSKHSAEHKIINFMERNKRLPKNIQEIEKSSRFSKSCGSAKDVDKIARHFVASIFAGIFSIMTGLIIGEVCKNSILEVIGCIFLYYIFVFIIYILLKKIKKIRFLIKPVKYVLTNLMQCANTTKKVRKKDFLMAYYVAKAWMLVVYPEFYNHQEDIFE